MVNLLIILKLCDRVSAHLITDDKKLQQFELTVYNTSDNEVLCGYHRDPVLTHSTITCTEPVIGRYVHFKKTGGPEIFWTPICDVVIIGHKYIGKLIINLQLIVYSCYLYH